ncbi:MAG: 23S rRNA (uracil(1939)-C(5))-methyltransferase RlmD [Candidatus Sumerlaeaceae bacterium]|nr:23S rRNA (uracil(1939)-C(5))-methyltransferase RlmD [Candidatus Sumerlaeaceae bacterium]
MNEKTFVNPPVRKNELVEVDVTALAFGGRGVARVENYVMFVEGGLPSERVKARITRTKPNYAEAVVEEILTPSPHRVIPPCPLFGKCGGCKLLHLDYVAQCQQKEKQIAEVFMHLAGVTLPELRPIVPSPEQWGYRNKMEMAFGASCEGKLAVGFHTPGDFRTVLDVPSCLLQPTAFDEIVKFLRVKLEALRSSSPEQYAPYNPVAHRGFWRHLVMRHSRATGEVLVAILTNDGDWPTVPQLAQEFLARFPQCQGFTWGINRGVSDVARMEEKRFEIGRGWIEERLGERTYRISTFSFFQTNSCGARLLYDAVKEFSELTGKERVLDAYCGTGSIGIYLADLAKEVVGVELVREAVWDARYNAQRNGLTNCTFLAGEMRDVLPTLGHTVGARFDRVIVDPPRGGMDKRSLKLLIGIGAPLLIYVSCNPATLARDAATLVAAGYIPECAQPVDLFPHTPHVECIIKFRKRCPS